MAFVARTKSLGSAPLLAVVALGASLAASVHAQTPPRDTTARFSLAAGLGGGSLTQSCVFSGCPVAWPSERTWMLRFGYRADQGIIGLEYNRWKRTRTVNGVALSQTYTWIGPSLQVYPFSARRLRGLHVQGLLAQATFDANPAPSGLHSLGYGAGIGYDVPLIYGLVLTPNAEILGADRAEKSERTTGRDGRETTTKVWYSAVMRSFGVALRFNGIP